MSLFDAVVGRVVGTATAPVRALLDSPVGPVVRGPVAAVARGEVRSVYRAVLHRDRRVSTVRGRTHIELRDLSADDLDRVAGMVRVGLETVEGVRWVEVNGALHRLVVAHEDGVDPDDLVDVVERTEDWLGFGDRPFPEIEHPADLEPLVRDLVGLGADVAGVTIGVAAQAVRFRPPPVEIDLAGILSVLEGAVPVRRTIERRLGVPLTDLSLGFANAVVQGLTHGPIGPMVDLAYRILEFGELSGRREAWLRREGALHLDPEHVRFLADGAGERPHPVPDGPVERFADEAWPASLVAFGVDLLVTRRPEKAVALLQAGLPKAARLGREGFVTQLAHVLAQRDVVVVEPGALRLLDRLDTLVVDAGILAAERPLLAPDQLLEAARSAGVRLLVVDPPAVARAHDAERLDAGADLLATVRRLQLEGGVVGLVSSRPGPALVAADVALGVHRPGSVPPWGADVLIGDDLADLLLLVEAAAVARQVSLESTTVALFGAGAASLFALVSVLPGSRIQSLSAVNVAAALALLNGARQAGALARRPQPLRLDPTPWHALDVEAVLDRLGSSRDGLSEPEAAARRRPEVKPPTLPVQFTHAVGAELANPLTPVLTAGAAMSAAVGSVADATLVAGVLVANGLVGGIQRVRADRAVAELGKVRRDDVTVLRGGVPMSLRPQHLAQGDVIVLGAGDVVPADCRLIASRHVEVDESALTGESMPVAKSARSTSAEVVAERSSMLYEGTWMASGEATAVVIATGPDTEAARSLVLAGDRPDVGVEARLESFTERMIPISVLSGAGVIALGLLRGQPLRRVIGSGVSLAVAAVPEGLPMLATVAQLGAARRLSKRNALVRNPRAIEALGRVDVVCADKTGTLTEGRIVLALVSDGATVVEPAELPDRLRPILTTALRATPITDDPERLTHPTDRAVASGGAQAGVGAGHQGQLGAAWSLDAELPFEPSRGFHAVAGATVRGRVLCVKGAPEVVLPRCTHRVRNGRRVKLTRATRASFDDHVHELGERGLRVLAVAERRDDVPERIDAESVAELTLLGFVGLADPAREAAARAVADLRRAGVAVKMITGDHPSTAQGIGAELDLLDGGRMLTGVELDALSDEELAEVVEDVTVFARVTPSHKVRIVRALQDRGRVVAMTGDGANDAPAIRLADVGVALGTRSTSAAQTAADLVLVDERIETLVEAIAEGRSMWLSVRDAVAMLVGGNLGEIGFTLVGTSIAGTSPLNARQLLLVNLLTDAAPAMAIVLRPPRDDVQDRLLAMGPDAALGVDLERIIATRAAVTASATGAAYLASRFTASPARANTVALATLVGTQLGQTLLSGVRDPYVSSASLGSAAVLAAIVQTPGLSHAFGCRPLGPVGWSIATSSSIAGTVGAAALPRVVNAVMARRDATPVS